MPDRTEVTALLDYDPTRNYVAARVAPVSGRAAVAEAAAPGRRFEPVPDVAAMLASAGVRHMLELTGSESANYQG